MLNRFFIALALILSAFVLAIACIMFGMKGLLYILPIGAGFFCVHLIIEDQKRAIARLEELDDSFRRYNRR